MADGSLLFDTKVDTKGVQEGMNQVSNIAKGTLSADIVKAGAKAMANLGKAAIEVGKNFETSMSQVAATMGITSEEIANGSAEFEMLKDKAKEMGATTKYTASEAAEGLNILAMAGLSAEEACAGIGDVMALAGAGAMSLEESATYVTGAVKGFGDSMENASMYTDIMAKGATMANTDVKGLGEALSRVSSNASAYNQSVESTSVALLRLAEQNVTGAEAATALSRVMADLYTPTDKAATALDKLGISTYDEAGNARDLNDVVDELNGALSGMSDEQKLAYENTIFTTFGMKGFQKMTVSTTETVNKFKDGIANASGSAMEQFATQTDNLEGKLAILNSALEATGIAIYEVFEDTMKDSVDSATDAVDKLHASIENGRLGDSLKNLASAAGDLLDSMIDFGTTALPPVIDALSFLVEHIPMILGALAGYKGALLAQEVATIATTIAQEGLNAALMANPVGAIAGAVALAVGGLVQAVSDINEAERKINSVADETVAAIESVSSATDKMRSSLEDFKGRDKYISGLASELKELNGLETLNDQQKRRVKEITSQLNSEYSDLNLQIDETTGKLAEECEGWEELLEVKMQQARYQEVADKMAESMKEQADAEYELWNNEQKLAQVQEERAEAMRELEQVSAADLDQIEILNSKITDLEKQEKILGDTRDELTAKTGELSSETENMQAYMDSLTLAEEGNAEAAGAAAETNIELSEAEQAAAEMAEEEAKALQEAKESLESTVESQVASFEKIKEASALSKEEVLTNLQSNIDAMNSWADNMNTLAARGIDDGLLQHLAEMGPEGAAQVQVFVDMTGDELSQAGSLWREAISAENVTNGIAEEYMTAGHEITQQFVNGAWEAVPEFDDVPVTMVDNFVGSAEWNRMPDYVKETVSGTMKTAKDEVSGSGNDLYDAATEAGEQVPKGMDDAAKKGTDQVKVTAKNLGDETIESLAEGAGESSPGAESTTAKEIGESVADSLADGIESRQSHVNTTARTTGEGVIKTLDTQLTTEVFKPIGRRVTDGLAEGIREGIDDVKTAAKEAAEAADSATRKTLKVESPSKVFEEIGQYCIAGFTQGFSGDSLQYSIGSTIQNSLSDITIRNQQAEVQPVVVESHVYLEGDAERVFRMVRTENKRIYETTGQNQLVI